MNKEKRIRKELKNLKGEKWLPLIGFEETHEVSNKGRIKSLSRIIIGGMHGKRTLITRILKASPQHGGYLAVSIKKDGRFVNVRVNRAVASTFIENPYGKPVVNHKNGIVTDNRVENLEWVTHAENIIHARDILGRVGVMGRFGKEHPRTKLIQQFDMNGNIVAEHWGSLEAYRNTGIEYSSISRCCNRKSKSAGGFLWEYAEKE